MILFGPGNEYIRRPQTPPFCPKCGSHRTEVIGQAEEPGGRTVRCNACGAVSVVRDTEAA